MDGTSKQLLRETKEPLPMEPGRVECRDYEYERGGECVSILRTATGWGLGGHHREAHQIKELVDERYPQAEQIVLVMDNLNIHTPASLYEAFDPKEAKRLAQKLEIHYTPKHGSWLNMVAIELSVLSRRCLDRRVADFESLQAEVGAWQERREGRQEDRLALQNGGCAHQAQATVPFTTGVTVY